MAKREYEKVKIAFKVLSVQDVLTVSGENTALSDIFTGTNKDAPWITGSGS